MALIISEFQFILFLLYLEYYLPQLQLPSLLLVYHALLPKELKSLVVIPLLLFVNQSRPLAVSAATPTSVFKSPMLTGYPTAGNVIIFYPYYVF